MIIKGVLKKAYVLLIACAFVLHSFSFALADYGRYGNYGDGNSFTNTITGMLAGVMQSSSTGTWGQWGMNTFTSSIGSYVGLYMYINYYHDYGKPLIKFNIGGAEISISKGQFYTMIASTVACSVAGLASGGYKDMGQWATDSSNMLVENTTKLFVSETIGDYLHEEFGIDRAITGVIGDTVASYAADSVSAAFLEGVGIITESDITEDGKLISSDEEKVEYKKAREKIEGAEADFKKAKEDYAKAVESKDANAANDAKRRQTLAILKMESAKDGYRKQFGHDPGKLMASDIFSAMKEPWTNTAYLWRGAVKAGVLLALDYDSYRGPNDDRETSNSLKLALAEGLGTTASLALGSEYNNEEVDYKTSDAIAYGLGSAVSNMAWISFLHEVDIPPSAVTDFVRLIGGGLNLGAAKRVSGEKPEKTYDEYLKENNLPSEKEHQTYEEYIHANNAMTEEEFYASKERRSSLSAGKVLKQAVKIGDGPDDEYNQYLVSKGLETPDGYNKGVKEYTSYEEAIRAKGGLTREEYNRRVYRPSTISGTIGQSVASGFKAASIGSDIGNGKGISSSNFYRDVGTNMEQQIDLMARGASAIQAQGAIIQNAFSNTASDNFGQSFVALANPAKKDKSEGQNKITQVSIKHSPEAIAHNRDLMKDPLIAKHLPPGYDFDKDMEEGNFKDLGLAVDSANAERRSANEANQVEAIKKNSELIQQHPELLRYLPQEYDIKKDSETNFSLLQKAINSYNAGINSGSSNTSGSVSGAMNSAVNGGVDMGMEVR